MTDLDLVNRCRQGDEMAFSQLVQRYQRKVYTVALGMVKNPDDAMDIAQEGFVKVHRYIGNFQGTSSFYTWLYRIVVNLCIDHLRKSGRYASDEYDERVHAQEGGGGVGVLSTNLGNNPSSNLGRKELAEVMQKAIDELPPYHRAVILMREVEGMSYTDMAKTLNVSKGTVMSRLHHARQKLQASLQPYLEGDLTVD
ncbi:MAG: sigma-70 family RNA polymerase sigma factor [Deltaproteobacteria bacterium]|nr:sigma-70 family RNA polymerase sigma factor [Deltaproteobacteria bacterium]MBN2670348.1 sigma-70 family RNA polymerase sigma factor [Deltaproteobacteria bacterium]